MTPVQLVCFHHAGGGSASFHPLRRTLAALGASVALTTVKLPERESRRDEARYVDADACVRALADELDGLLSRPHVLLGHRIIRRSRNRSVSSPAATFCFRQPDPRLVTAVARVVEDVALERR